MYQLKINVSTSEEFVKLIQVLDCTTIAENPVLIQRMLVMLNDQQTIPEHYTQINKKMREYLPNLNIDRQQNYYPIRKIGNNVFPNYLVNALKKLGIEDSIQLQQYSWKQLKEMKGLGGRSIHLIEVWCFAKNITLSPE